MYKLNWATRVAPTAKSLDPEECKEDIVKLNCKVKALIQDVWDCKGPLEALNDLNEEAQKSLAELRGKIDQLEVLSNEVDDERIRHDLLEMSENQTKQLHNTQAALRKANLACKLAIDSKERDALLGLREIRQEKLRHRHKTFQDREQAVQTASSVTENLLSISRTMQDTVKQSESSLHTLVTSSGTIKETSQELKGQSGLIQTSHRLLTKYNRREFTDKILIFLAMALFFATVVYILKRRLFPSY